jgi:hypothetical protein
LDPERIAALVPEGISSYVAGIFHVTEMNNLWSIFRHGLHPGGMQRNSRMDVHFMTYFPTDPRNEYMRARQWQNLHIKRSKAKSNLIVLSIHQRALWSEEVRIRLSTGFLLMDKVLSTNHGSI